MTDWLIDWLVDWFLLYLDKNLHLQKLGHSLWDKACNEVHASSVTKKKQAPEGKDQWKLKQEKR